MCSIVKYKDVKVVVSNLDERMSEDDLTELFGRIGTVTKVKLCDQNIAEIIFDKKEDAQKAINVFNKGIEKILEERKKKILYGS